MTGTNLKTKAKPAAETRCLGYARISTYGQTLDAQLEQLRRDGCTQAYKEKVSGARTDRRQLFRMLKGGAPGGARRGRFVRDSPLEEDGFELAVPPRRERLWAATPGKHCRFGPEPVSGSAFRAAASDWQRLEEPFARAGPMVRIRFPPPATLSRKSRQSGGLDAAPTLSRSPLAAEGCEGLGKRPPFAASQNH